MRRGLQSTELKGSKLYKRGHQGKDLKGSSHTERKEGIIEHLGISLTNIAKAVNITETSVASSPKTITQLLSQVRPHEIMDIQSSNEEHQKLMVRKTNTKKTKKVEVRMSEKDVLEKDVNEKEEEKDFVEIEKKDVIESEEEKDDSEKEDVTSRSHYCRKGNVIDDNP
ncbi:hypothetical protein Droror1_Dr00023425 [Drosera rotundifolia]